MSGTQTAAHAILGREFRHLVGLFGTGGGDRNREFRDRLQRTSRFDQGSRSGEQRSAEPKIHYDSLQTIRRDYGP